MHMSLTAPFSKSFFQSASGKMLKRDGDEFLHGSISRIEAERVRRAGKRRVLALLVEDVALPDDIVFTLLLTALGADFGVGIEVKFVGRLREDDRADVAPFHDKRSLPSQALLPGHKELADGGNLRDQGDAFVDLTFAHVRERVEACDAENKFAFVEAGFDSGGLDFPRDGFGIPKRDVLLLEIPCDAPVHGPGIDVNVTEALGELARKGAFAGCGGAINGDNGMRLSGHVAWRVLRTAVKKSAPHRSCEFKTPAEGSIFCGRQ